MRYVHGNGAVSMGEKTAADLMRYKKLYDEYVKKSNNIRNMYDEYGIYKKWLDLYKTISKKEYQK